jgi:CRP-like cAMP-binding protein
VSDQTIEEQLAAASFFHDIPAEHLQRLAQITRRVEIPAHQEFFHERDKARDFFVIVSGKVSVVICLPKIGCRELLEVGAGDVMALSPLVGRARLLDSARTKEDTVALALDGEEVLEFCRKNPDFGFEFMHRVSQGLASRLSATRLQFMEMAGFHLPEVQLESD